jgi:hypothetical protein
VEIMFSFMFPSCLPSTCRCECDTFIAPTGRLGISDHRGVFTFICCHFCGKTGSYYTRKSLPYTTQEGGSTTFAAASMLLIRAWSQLIKIHIQNHYNASNCQLVILWKWCGYQCHYSKPCSSYRK